MARDQALALEGTSLSPAATRVVGSAAARVEPLPPSAPTVYLGLDGTGVPVPKREAAGRAGKHDDGSARTHGVKLTTVWRAQSRHPQTGRPP